MSVDPKIVKLLKKHHLLTVCTAVGNEPWCASCFYAYLEDENAFVFTTDHKTRHGQEFLENSFVAGTIALETKIVGRIEGVQFQGIASEPSGDRLKKAKRRYLKRFPYAALMDTHLWIIDLTLLKMTHNTLLGFGKKLVWQASEASASEHPSPL